MKYLFTTLVISFAVLMASCESNSTSSDPINERVTLNVTMKHTFGQESVEPEVSIHTNTSGNVVKFTKLHYLLTDFIFISKDGEVIDVDSASAYINMTEGLVDFTLPDIPEGSYKEIRFLLGVDSITNHQNPNSFPATSPLNPIINNLYWNWMDGFIFCSVEGFHYKEGQMKGAFAYHVGLDENLMQISIKKEFNVTKGIPLELLFDLSAYFESPHVINITENVPITHSDNAADFGLSSKLSENLLNAFKLKGE